MKKYFIVLLLIVVSFVGCSSDDDNDYRTNVVIKVSTNDVAFDNVGGTTTADVNVAEREWGAYTTQSWLSVTPTSSLAHSGTITITAEENTDTISREAKVVIKSGTERAYVNIKQAAAPKK